MAERQGERESWTLCISGDVDRLFVVSVNKVRSVQALDRVQLALIFDNCTFLLCLGEHSG